MKLKDILELMTDDSLVEIEYWPTRSLKATIDIDMDDGNKAVDEAIEKYGECDVLWLQDEDYKLIIRIGGVTI